MLCVSQLSEACVKTSQSWSLTVLAWFKGCLYKTSLTELSEGRHLSMSQEWQCDTKFFCSLFSGNWVSYVTLRCSLLRELELRHDVDAMELLIPTTPYWTNAWLPAVRINCSKPGCSQRLLYRHILSDQELFIIWKHEQFHSNCNFICPLIFTWSGCFYNQIGPKTKICK